MAEEQDQHFGALKSYLDRIAQRQENTENLVQQLAMDVTSLAQTVKALAAARQEGRVTVPQIITMSAAGLAIVSVLMGAIMLPWMNMVSNMARKQDTFVTHAELDRERQYTEKIRELYDRIHDGREQRKSD